MDGASGEVVGGGIDQIGDLAKNANNDAITVVAILAIAFIIVLVIAITLYTIYTKKDKDKLAQYIKREDRILQVIDKNSDANTKVAEAFAGLKAVLDTNNNKCDQCKSEQMIVLNNIRDGQNQANMMIARLLERKESDGDEQIN